MFLFGNFRLWCESLSVLSASGGAHWSPSRTAILFYDHLLTFDDEVNFIWLNRKIGSSYLFVLNRYFAFFAVRRIPAVLLDHLSYESTQNITVLIGAVFPVLHTSEVRARYPPWSFTLMSTV